MQFDIELVLADTKQRQYGSHRTETSRLHYLGANQAFESHRALPGCIQAAGHLQGRTAPVQRGRKKIREEAPWDAVVETEGHASTRFGHDQE